MLKLLHEHVFVKIGNSPIQSKAGHVFSNLLDQLSAPTLPNPRYNSLLHCCAKTGDGRRAQELLANMELDGVRADIITSTAPVLVKNACSKRTIHLSERRMEEVALRGALRYNTAITALAKIGAVDEATGPRLFREPR